MCLRSLAIVGVVIALQTAAWAATITVNSAADSTANDGSCTLREAITAANGNAASGAMAGECAAGEASPTIDRIEFNISGPGIPTIAPTSALPALVEEVAVDGSTQAAGFVEIDGTGAGTGIALDVDTDDSEIRGLVINGFSTNSFDGAVRVRGERNVVAGNRIGTNAAGTAASANDIGIELEAANNRVGGVTGTTPGGACTGDCNLISGNHIYGIATRGAMVATDNLIQGNFVGVDVTGTMALSDQTSGMDICSARNQIGGTIAAARNLVSGNDNDGICIGCGCSTGSGNNVVEGNYVGVDTTGTVAIPGHANSGVRAEAVRIGGDIGLSSGGPCTGACNLISGNMKGIITDDDDGEIVGNFIGTDFSGQSPIPNTTSGIELKEDGFVVRGNLIAFNGEQGITRHPMFADSVITGNRIFSNGELGIDVGTDGVTNDRLAVILRVANLSGQVQASASVIGTPGVEYTFDFFSSRECDPSGFGEGEYFLGRASAVADGSGLAEVSITAPAQFGGFYTATVTDESEGATFEFSECRLASNAAPALDKLGLALLGLILLGLGTTRLGVPRREKP